MNLFKQISPFLFLFFLFFACQKKEETNYESLLYKTLIQKEAQFWKSASTAQILLNRMQYAQNQILWSTNNHTAAPVPIGAVGPEKYTRMLQGIIHNDSVGRVIKAAIDEHINVIMVIGDGMGNMHMALPVYMREAKKEMPPTMFRRIMSEGSCGYLYTSTARGLVTGSAASGTALACGKKTLINMIGKDSSGVNLESALSRAKKNDYRTALVTNASVTDATPAVFFAHTHNRDAENEIARQLSLSDEADIVLGGGICRFIPQNTDFSHKSIVSIASERADDLNLLDTFQKSGYALCHTLSELNDCTNSKKILGLFAGGGLPAPIEMKNGFADKEIPSLSQMAEKALNLIAPENAKQAYFAMIECARIDWEAHDNDAAAVYYAVENMNDVLQTAYLNSNKKCNI